MNKAGKELETLKKEEIKKENKPEINDVLEKLLKGEDIFETVETNRGTFVIKFPRPKVLRQIQVLLSRRFVDVDLSKMPNSTVRFYEVYATLDLVIVKAPKWWDDLDSSEDCPDDALIAELYRRYLHLYNKVQSDIGGVGTASGPDTTKSTSEPKEEAVGDGAFSDITYRPKIDKSNR